MEETQEIEKYRMLCERIDKWCDVYEKWSNKVIEGSNQSFFSWLMKNYEVPNEVNQHIKTN